MANLASTFWNQGQWEESEKLEVQVLETRKRRLGVEHPSMLTTLTNLAFTWKSSGRKTDALNTDLFRQAEKSLWPDHHDTLYNSETLLQWEFEGLNVDV
ncbi:hypothetical protein N7530_008882 [Penicillium desertorum]|uniref:Kinesin light chain n=1 Tax=Penicillium desertorum TaxID=1303715 RepID=A0A9W9WPX5_9EURO|nr:hypothetical protein N7530_008882 [Penicillium desertorum]